MSRLVLLLAPFAATADRAAAQRSLVIERFDAVIWVEPGGTIDVTETITARFTGAWNGIYRSIPVKYRTAQGFNWTLGLDVLGATDADGQPLRLESGREGHNVKLRMWIPGAEDATRTAVLHYWATNALRFFDEHDELYWNVTGDEWEVPIEAATARNELPPNATGLRAIAFNGAYGSTAQDASVAIWWFARYASNPAAYRRPPDPGTRRSARKPVVLGMIELSDSPCVLDLFH